MAIYTIPGIARGLDVVVNALVANASVYVTGKLQAATGFQGDASTLISGILRTTATSSQLGNSATDGFSVFGVADSTQFATTASTFLNPTSGDPDTASSIARIWDILGAFGLSAS